MTASTSTIDPFPGFSSSAPISPGKEIEDKISISLGKIFSYITSDSQVVGNLSNLFQEMVVLNPKIATGSFGKVLKVRFSKIDSKDLALKLIRRDELLSDEKKRERRLKTLLIGQERIPGEGLALQLKHENLIETKAVITLAPDGSAHLKRSIDPARLNGHHVVGIFSEYFKSKELFDIINDKLKNNDSLSIQYIQQVGSAIGKALQYLHDKNIIHRDLKPENILINDDNDLIVKLIDYGLLRDLTKTKDGRTTTFGGTYNYMAPEIILGDSYGTKVDSFAFGILLYYLYFKSYPWNVDSHADPQKYYELLVDYGKSNQSLTQFFNFRLPDRTPKEIALTDLIEKLTHSNLTKRLNIKDAVNHPFFKFPLDSKHAKLMGLLSQLNQHCAVKMSIEMQGFGFQ